MTAFDDDLQEQMTDPEFRARFENPPLGMRLWGMVRRSPLNRKRAAWLEKGLATESRERERWEHAALGWFEAHNKMAGVVADLNNKMARKDRALLQLARWDEEDGHDGHHPGACQPCQRVFTARAAMGPEDD